MSCKLCDGHVYFFSKRCKKTENWIFQVIVLGSWRLGWPLLSQPPISNPQRCTLHSSVLTLSLGFDVSLDTCLRAEVGHLRLPLADYPDGGVRDRQPPASSDPCFRDRVDGYFRDFKRERKRVGWASPPHPPFRTEVPDYPPPAFSPLNVISPHPSVHRHRDTNAVPPRGGRPPRVLSPDPRTDTLRGPGRPFLHKLGMGS